MAVDLMEKKLRQAVALGAKLLVDGGLGYYAVGLQNKRTSLADCNSYSRVIRYSTHFIRVCTEKQFKDVTIHEMAHALVGNHHGHDAVFKNKVYELGGDDNVSSSKMKEPVAVHKYDYRCPNCGATARSNKIRNFYCSKCVEKGRWTVPLVRTEHIPAVLVW